MGTSFTGEVSSDRLTSCPGDGESHLSAEHHRIRRLALTFKALCQVIIVMLHINEKNIKFTNQWFHSFMIVLQFRSSNSNFELVSINLSHSDTELFKFIIYFNVSFFHHDFGE